MELEKLFEITIIQPKQESMIGVNNFIDTVLAPCLESKGYYFVRNGDGLLSIYMNKLNKPTNNFSVTLTRDTANNTVRIQ